MSSCLGMYIEENLIKYAKVTKDKDMIKVESFGIKFYEKIGEAINQIISETYSYHTPISINLSEEAYNYFYFFNLLSKNDLKKAIETEFASFCSEKNYNRNALETRYALVPSLEDKEKIKAIYISVNKAELTKRKLEFGENPIAMYTSLPMAISNVAEIKPKENVIIINIEDHTDITKIINGSIYEIKRIEEGMETILTNINLKENSYSKAYEICKNTTIYTADAKELLQPDMDSNTEHLEDIMPTLYEIANKTKEYIQSDPTKIDKIYITGTGSIINNIDLYFQEFLGKTKCEILKPYFIKNTLKINIKDYIEVNSAIALALQQLGYGVANLNFKKKTLSDSLPSWAKFEITSGKEKDSKKTNNIAGKIASFFNFKQGLRGGLDNFEKWLLRVAISFLEITIIYCVITGFLNSQMQNKLEEVNKQTAEETAQIAKADSDLQKIKSKTTSYTSIVENLEKFDKDTHESEVQKDKIPELLSKIMFAIPQGVTLTSIENTTQTTSSNETRSHIYINAQSSRYDLLGYFIGNIKNDQILINVQSTSGTSVNGTVKIVIEGDIP